jgi:hypothetical protein
MPLTALPSVSGHRDSDSAGSLPDLEKLTRKRQDGILSRCPRWTASRGLCDGCIPVTRDVRATNETDYLRSRRDHGSAIHFMEVLFRH